MITVTRLLNKHDFKGALELAEQEIILSALRYTGGNKRRCAQLLGLSRGTLYTKLRNFEHQGGNDIAFCRKFGNP